MTLELLNTRKYINRLRNIVFHPKKLGCLEPSAASSFATSDSKTRSPEGHNFITLLDACT